MPLQVNQISEEEKKKLKIPPAPANKDGWSIWECEPSLFEWSYESEEAAYLYKGRVKVTADGKTVEIKAGDLAVFPAGLTCRWEVLEKVVKVYRFR